MLKCIFNNNEDELTSYHSDSTSRQLPDDLINVRLFELTKAAAKDKKELLAKYEELCKRIHKQDTYLQEQLMKQNDEITFLKEQIDRLKVSHDAVTGKFHNSFQHKFVHISPIQAIGLYLIPKWKCNRLPLTPRAPILRQMHSLRL